MTKKPMDLGRPNSKDIVSDENSNIHGSSIFEKFRGNQLSLITNFKNFPGICFRKSAFSGVKKGNQFQKFGQNSQNSRNFLTAKNYSLAFFEYLQRIALTQCFLNRSLTIPL